MPAGIHFAPSWAEETTVEWTERSLQESIDLIQQETRLWVIVSNKKASPFPIYLERFDPKAVEFCEKEELLDSLRVVRHLIEESFEGIESINIEYRVDPEIAGYERICFSVTVSGEPSRVLEYESRFRNRLRQEVPREERKFFLLSYELK
ncbi:MAG: hypothetical protein E3J82_01270 [Candidatus Thorarchaeota archaeon]|nr:MAG: hypothetical protein E3J82_01270 [Candidatus Thorarchaeota archaeon]